MVYTDKAHTHAYTDGVYRCIICVVDGILGNLIQVFPLWEGRKGKGEEIAAARQREKMETRQRKESNPARGAVGSAASKRIYEMTDCAPVRRLEATQLPGSLCLDMTAVRPRRVWGFTNDVQSIEFSTGGLPSRLRNFQRPAKLNFEGRRVSRTNSFLKCSFLTRWDS